ncbi:hypothetical protein [Chitinophaga silvisoli]|uniref:Uncharacterized protein n=1 Tax=Chitinophaga silvisoli TaxID=2291814 RepID=A0A3E1P908_9BACT|nr:hypothetical protein [Chitinophaga silvisoli]RFM36669.1 hypothetical protein DXN04_03990 [Chitinophaga silvisoli]
MKKQTHFITSTYFISLIKSWLQGTKTRPEIISETADVLHLTSIDPSDVTYLLITVAREMNEDFYTDIVAHINYDADTVPTRKGLIHHLNALLAEEITLQEFMEWARWYSIDEDQLSAGIFEDFVVEYFCLDFLSANDDVFSPYMCRRALEILEYTGASPTQQKIALTLLPGHELDDFKEFLSQVASQHPSTTFIDRYLMKKFGMDHESFPYMQELLTQGTAALLKKAQLLTT